MIWLVFGVILVHSDLTLALSSSFLTSILLNEPSCSRGFFWTLFSERSLFIFFWSHFRAPSSAFILHFITYTLKEIRKQRIFDCLFSSLPSFFMSSLFLSLWKFLLLNSDNAAFGGVMWEDMAIKGSYGFWALKFNSMQLHVFDPFILHEH